MREDNRHYAPDLPEGGEQRVERQREKQGRGQSKRGGRGKQGSDSLISTDKSPR